MSERGVRMLDAPVSGGEPFAVAGTLSFMVGGPRDAFDDYPPVLRAMGSSVTHVGGVGAGNTVKLANQAIVAVNIAVVAEALVLAQKAGVEPQAVVSAIQGGLAGSNVMNAEAPMTLAHDFRQGFRVGLHLKDLTNVMATAHDIGAPMPLTAAVFELMTQLKARGFAESDHSYLREPDSPVAWHRLLEIVDGTVAIPQAPGLGIQLDEDRLLAAHQLYQDQALGARDDSAGMQHLLPGWAFDPRRPCLQR